MVGQSIATSVVYVINAPCSVGILLLPSLRMRLRSFHSFFLSDSRFSRVMCSVMVYSLDQDGWTQADNNRNSREQVADNRLVGGILSSRILILSDGNRCFLGFFRSNGLRLTTDDRKCWFCW